jgi:hypothetical protein
VLDGLCDEVWTVEGDLRELMRKEMVRIRRRVGTSFFRGSEGGKMCRSVDEGGEMSMSVDVLCGPADIN